MAQDDSDPVVTLDYADPWERVEAIVKGYKKIFEGDTEIALHQLVVDIFLTLDTANINFRDFLTGVLTTLQDTQQEDKGQQLAKILECR